MAAGEKMQQWQQLLVLLADMSQLWKHSF